jgi:phosphomannomutase
MESPALSCFKAYDIRGKVPEELDAAMAEKVGRAFAAVFNLKKVVVGYDIRLSSEEIVRGLVKGLLDGGGRS